MARKDSNAQPEQKLILRPIIGLTENLPNGDLEEITIEAIKRHRRLRDLAEGRWEQYQAAPPIDPGGGTVGSLRLAYITAMIDMHAQQTVLSTLLDLLGYIPSVPAD